MKRPLRFAAAAIVLAALAYQLFRLWNERHLPPPEALNDVRTSDHFVIRTNLDADSAAHQARAFEAFAVWFEAQYFAVRAPKPLDVYAFGDTASYAAYCSRHVPISMPFGFYDRDKNVVAFDGSTGIGTAAHELTHHFIRHGMREAPPSWIDEGFAAFFEKLFGYLDEQGRLVVTVGYFNPWRFEIAKRSYSSWDLAELTREKSVDQSAARTLMLFLHRQKKLTPFIRRVAAATNVGDGVALLEAEYGKPLGEIDREWKLWIAAQPIDEEVRLLPRSQILPLPTWQTWWSENQARLVLDPAENRYRLR